MQVPPPIDCSQSPIFLWDFRDWCTSIDHRGEREFFTILFPDSISYLESSGFLVSGWAPGETLEPNSKKINFLIGCPITDCIILPQKARGNKIPVSQSLSWRPPTDQEARGPWVRDWPSPPPPPPPAWVV